MLDQLNNLIKDETIFNLTWDIARWDSLVINRRHPETIRLFTMYNGLRICLHRFKPCDKEESFEHPHPWPAAFKVLDGSYSMRLGRYFDLYTDTLNMDICTMIFTKGSSYEMTDPLLFHSIAPITITSTIMINGPEYKKQHVNCRRTKGKDLDKLNLDAKMHYLSIFREYLFSQIQCKYPT